jgi:uncharacterized paraquat-inducible protein A
MAASLAALGRQSETEPAPKHGAIPCDLCSGLIAADVPFVGQELICPRCGHRCKAPGVTPGRHILIYACVAIAGAALLVLLLWARGRL